jgi:hypothetical protein
VDFNKLMTEELSKARKGNMFAAKPEPTPQDLHAHITIDEETDLNEEFGPQQVQSLLGLVVDSPLSKALSDAEDDADAVRHLNRLKYRGG